MPTHEPFADPVLGRATWDDGAREWQFSFTLPSGHVVAGSVTPEDSQLHLSAPELVESRECIRWIRDHETTLRQYIADTMYSLMLDWHDDSAGSPLTQDEFREAIRLVGIQVLEDQRAVLLYDDAGLFGGHTITFPAGADG